MVTALILAGGTGVRLGGNTPKQYLMVKNRPVIAYCLDIFERHSKIDKIIIVAADEWRKFINEWIRKEKITKFAGYADAGESRQHSILSGLIKMKDIDAKMDDIVIIHDAARPCVSNEIIDECITALDDADGAMPVITVKDTIYYSEDGKNIEHLLNRDKLFAGQAPESFRYGKYYEINIAMSDEELRATRGTTEVAYKNGLNIHMFKGAESNYKITTMEDLDKFRLQIAGGRH